MGAKGGASRLPFLLLFVVANETAVDEVGTARNICAFVGCEERDDSGNIVR